MINKIVCVHSVHYTRSVCVLYAAYTIDTQYNMAFNMEHIVLVNVMCLLLFSLRFCIHTSFWRVLKVIPCLLLISILHGAQHSTKIKVKVCRKQREKMMQSKRFRNENGNVDLMLQRMRSCLKGRQKYIIFFSGCWNISKHFKWYIK